MKNENAAENKKPVRGGISVMEMAVLGLFIAIIILMAYTPIGLIDLPVIKATILHVPVIIGAILLGPKEGAILGLTFGLTSMIKNTSAPSLLSFAFSPLIPVPGAERGSLWAVVICLLPRVLVGVIPALIASAAKYIVLQRVRHTAKKDVQEYEKALESAKRFQEKEQEERNKARAEAGLPPEEKKGPTEDELKKQEAKRQLPVQAPAGARAVIYAVCGVIGSFVNTILVMGLIGMVFQDAYAIAREMPVTQVSAAIMTTVAVNGVPEAIAAAVLVPLVCVAVERTGVLRPVMEKKAGLQPQR